MDRSSDPDWTCVQVDHVDFHVDKTVTAQPASVAGVGVDVNFDVTYDPSSVGDCRSQVTLTSPVGGDYVFPLRATCTLPKPQASWRCCFNVGHARAEYARLDILLPLCLHLC